ncbi:MAG: membrane protein insertion efficiency factor YidD [Pirellulales bacterium]
MSEFLRRAVALVISLPARAAIFCVRIYQWLISPFLGQRCRFVPSCSRYFIGAVEKYGLIRGGLKGVARICRCHPWHPGGYDPP